MIQMAIIGGEPSWVHSHLEANLNTYGIEVERQWDRIRPSMTQAPPSVRYAIAIGGSVGHDLINKVKLLHAHREPSLRILQGDKSWAKTAVNLRKAGFKEIPQPKFKPEQLTWNKSNMECLPWPPKKRSDPRYRIKGVGSKHFLAQWTSVSSLGGPGAMCWMIEKRAPGDFGLKQKRLFGFTGTEEAVLANMGTLDAAWEQDKRPYVAILMGRDRQERVDIRGLLDQPYSQMWKELPWGVQNLLRERGLEPGEPKVAPPKQAKKETPMRKLCSKRRSFRVGSVPVLAVRGPNKSNEFYWRARRRWSEGGTKRESQVWSGWATEAVAKVIVAAKLSEASTATLVPVLKASAPKINKETLKTKRATKPTNPEEDLKFALGLLLQALGPMNISTVTLDSGGKWSVKKVVTTTEEGQL